MAIGLEHSKKQTLEGYNAVTRHIIHVNSGANTAFQRRHLKIKLLQNN